MGRDLRANKTQSSRGPNQKEIKNGESSMCQTDKHQPLEVERGE